MSFVGSTDLAAVRTKQGPVLFYQKDANIYQAKKEGSKWVTSPVLEGNHLETWGSPITAYSLEHDGSFKDKSTIHVVFKDKDNVLREIVRASDEDKWEELAMPAEIKSAIVSTSKLASGVCHDDVSNKGHHWLFFVSQNPDATIGGVVVSEIRKGSESSYKWAFTKTLPEKRGTALEGTKMSAHLTDATTRLYFQNHNEEVVQYNWTNSTWSGENVIRKQGQVANNSAISVSAPHTQDEPHLFFVQTVGGKNQIKHAFNGKETEMATWVGGSTLGSTTVDGVTYLFYVGADKPTNIQVQKLENGAWSKGEIVV